MRPTTGKLLILAVLSLAPISSAGVLPAAGPWRAWIESDHGPIDFGLVVRHEPEFSVWTVNGPDTTRVPDARIDGPTLVLDFDQYDSRVRARVGDDGASLDGVWTRRFDFGGETSARMVFRARCEDERTPPDLAALAPRWAVQLDDLPHRSVLRVVTTPEHGLHGNLWNGNGDYGMMGGRFDGEHLRLSKFDGAHAMLLAVRVIEDERLDGVYLESGYRVTTVAGRADADAPPPPTFEQFEIVDRFELDGPRFPSLEGPDRTLAEIADGHRAIVLEVFGTWCPTCHPLSTFLEELYREHRDRGLLVVGMAFEMQADLERNRTTVERYRRRYDLSYPMIFGFSDEGRPPRDVFPQIEGVFSYPSVLFLRPDGSIVAAHAGFAGPATGDAHTKVRQEFRALVEEMLAGR